MRLWADGLGAVAGSTWLLGKSRDNVQLHSLMHEDESRGYSHVINLESLRWIAASLGWAKAREGLPAEY